MLGAQALGQVVPKMAMAGENREIVLPVCTPAMSAFVTDVTRSFPLEHATRNVSTRNGGHKMYHRS